MLACLSYILSLNRWLRQKYTLDDILESNKRLGAALLSLSVLTVLIDAVFADKGSDHKMLELGVYNYVAAQASIAAKSHSSVTDDLRKLLDHGYLKKVKRDNYQKL